MIACTQGGITVIGAGVSVDVEANQLTVIQDDNAPSEAKTISSEDLQNLEQSFEPNAEAQTQEETTSKDSDESKENTTQNEEEEQQEESVVAQDETPDDEAIIENQIKEEQVTEETPITEEVVQETNEQVNNVVDDTQAQTQAQLAQAQAQEAQNALVTQAQEAALQAQVEQVKANTVKTETTTILSALPTSEDMTNLQNQVSSAGDSTQTSLNSAVTSLSNATNSETVNSTAKTDVNTASTNAITTTAQALTDANTFQTNTTGSYTTILNTAQTKAAEAQTAYNTAVTQAGLAQNALTQAQENGAPSSVISSIQLAVTKANEAVSDSQSIANEAANAVSSLRTTISNTASQAVIDAQAAADNATILSQLSSLLNSLEDTKQASIEATTANTSAQTAKTATETASNAATSASTALLSAKQSIITAKSDVLTASNDSLSATSTATNGSTSNIQVAYSAKIAEDKASLAKTKADQAVANAVISANKLIEAQTAVNEMNNQLTATQSALTLAQQKLTAAQTALSAAQTTEAGITSSNTSAKTAAQSAVAKAQVLYNTALSAKTAAQTAVTNAQAIVTALDSATLLATLGTANTQAQADATSATTIANTALTTAVTATTAATTASTNVKTTILAKTKVSIDEDGNSVNNTSHTFVLSGEKTNEQLTGQNFGGYTGSTELGVFKQNISDVNPLMQVQADSLQEFFVSYSSSSNPTKSLSIYGNSNVSYEYNPEKIYVYKGFKSFTNSSTAVLKNDGVYYYYNPVLNSSTAISKDFFTMGAKRFVSGDKTSLKVIENEFVSGSIGSVQVNTTTSTGTTSFIGTQVQGMVNNLTNTNPDSSTSSTITTAFLNNIEGQETEIINKTITGRSKMVTYEPSQSAIGSRSANVNLTIADDGGTITGSIKHTNSELIMNLSGTVSAKTAYYINNDIFGVHASGLSGTQNGFLVAVPDGAIVDGKFEIFDANDNPLTTNDDASWGYWSGKEYLAPVVNSGNSSTAPQSVWIAGTETNSGIIDSMVNAGSTQNLTFKGKVMGYVNYTNPILMDDTNQVNMNFNVGGGVNNMNGTMKFKSANSVQFNTTMNVNSVTNTGFSGTLGGTDSSSFKGKYYGDGSVKSLGGEFNAQKGGDYANGVFKAVKE